MFKQSILNPHNLNKSILTNLGDNNRNLCIFNYKNQSKHTLCLGESDLEIKGCIRFNPNTNQFEGFNGTDWIVFNAEKGEPGDKGDNFLDKITLINQGSTSESGNLFDNDSLGFKNNTKQELKIKSIHPSQYCKIENHPDYIQINPLPQPYSHQVSSSISFIKGQESDSLFKAFGDVSIHCVAPNTIIHKGQACRFVNQNENLYIEPFTYKSRINQFKDNTSYCGIALEDGEDNQCIKICSRGITTAKYSFNVSEHFIANKEIKTTGLPALISSDGYNFNSLIKPSIFYIQSGVFIETNNNIEQNDYCLIKIE